MTFNNNSFLKKFKKVIINSINKLYSELIFKIRRCVNEVLKPAAWQKPSKNRNIIIIILIKIKILQFLKKMKKKLIRKILFILKVD